MKKPLLFILLILFLVIGFALYKIYPKASDASDSLTNCKVWMQECNTCNIIVEKGDTVSATCTEMGCGTGKIKQLTCLEYFKDDEQNLRCKVNSTNAANEKISGYYFDRADGVCKEYYSGWLYEWPFKTLEECQNTCG